MKFRKLRIAWSVFWGIACVLLIVLWVRSYRGYVDYFQYHIGGRNETTAFSFDGKLALGEGASDIDIEGKYTSSPWNIGSESPGEYVPIGDAISSNWAMGLGSSKFAPYVVVPHWFALLICSALAAALWYRWLTYRFSLRTLLIATTVVAVVLGLAVWLRR